MSGNGLSSSETMHNSLKEEFLKRQHSFQEKKSKKKKQTSFVFKTSNSMKLEKKKDPFIRTIKTGLQSRATRLIILPILNEESENNYSQIIEEGEESESRREGKS